MTVPLKARLLLADDHAVVRRGLRLVLDAEPDLEVVAEAGDGAQAVQSVLDDEIDLAVLDVSMPGATGLQVCEALRGDPATAGIRILLLSAGASPDEIARGLAAGADAYLPKPFGIAALVQQIRALSTRQPA